MLDSKKMAKVLIDLYTKRGASDTALDAYLNFLEEKKALHLLPSIVKHVERLQGDLLDSQTLSIRAAQPLDEESLLNFCKSAGISKETPVRFFEEKDLLGGFIASYDGRIYDASLRGQVQHLKKILTY